MTKTFGGKEGESYFTLGPNKVNIEKYQVNYTQIFTFFFTEI